MQRLTKEQAAIIGLYTGVACGPFQDIQELAEKVAECPLWTHQFANEALWKELKEKVKPQFIALCYDPDEKQGG